LMAFMVILPPGQKENPGSVWGETFSGLTSSL
jgi:hypothetical protein